MPGDYRVTGPSSPWEAPPGIVLFQHTLDILVSAGLVSQVPGISLNVRTEAGVLTSGRRSKFAIITAAELSFRVSHIRVYVSPEPHVVLPLDLLSTLRELEPVPPPVRSSVNSVVDMSGPTQLLPRSYYSLDRCARRSPRGEPTRGPGTASVTAHVYRYAACLTDPL